MTTLRTFKVDGTLVGRTTGPTVTQFEIEPAPGVKVRQIAMLNPLHHLAEGLRWLLLAGKPTWHLAAAAGFWYARRHYGDDMARAAVLAGTIDMPGASGPVAGVSARPA